MEPIKKALIYCRVSSKKQELEGSGLTSQEKRCQDYAHVNGYIVEHVFQDTYSGGGDFMKRPAMRLLLKYADEHPETSYTVIFDDMKRFARDTVFHLKLRQEFYHRNLEPKCLNFNFENTPEGEFIETILAAQGQLEREQNKRQVVQKMRARMLRGIYSVGGNNIYGYQYVKSREFGGKVLIPHSTEISIVKEALERFATGSLYHVSDFIRFINNSGINRSKSGICAKTAKSMLTNILYAGYIEYPNWDVPRIQGIHEPIISLDTFEKIQDRFLGKIPKLIRKDISLDFPLRGLVFCSYCQKPLTASWSKGRSKMYPFYRCIHKGCKYGNKSIRKDIIETLFVNKLKMIEPHPTVFKVSNYIISFVIRNKRSLQASRRNHLEKELMSVKRLVDELSEKLVTAAQPVIVGIYEKKITITYKKQKLLQDALKKSPSKVFPELEPVTKQALDLIKSPYKFWENNDFIKKRLTVQTLFGGMLTYDPITGFGTAEKCYILRFFEEKAAFFHQDYDRVDKPLTKENLDSVIARNGILNNMNKDVIKQMKTYLKEMEAEGLDLDNVKDFSDLYDRIKGHLDFMSLNPSYIFVFLYKHRKFLGRDIEEVKKVQKAWSRGEKLPGHEVFDDVVKNWDNIVSSLTAIGSLNSNH